MNAAPSPGHHGALHRRGLVLMLASVVFFVANALVVRALTEVWAVDSWITTAVRFVVGLILVSLPGMPSGRAAARRVLGSPLLIARGVIGSVGVFLYYYTVAEIGAGRATFINATYVVWGAVMAAVVLREPLRPAVIAALAVSSAGMALLTGVAYGEWAVSRGDALALVGALSSAIVIVLIRRAHGTETTGSIFAAQCAWGLIVAAVPATHAWQMPAVGATIVLVVSGLLAGGGQLTMTAAYRHLPVAEGSLLQLLLPLGIGIGGAVFFAERHSLAEGVGAALIIAGCLLTIRTRPRLAAELPADLQPTTAANGAADAARK
jgi:drug/metabolite transporter (DMT)-like permease